MKIFTLLLLLAGMDFIIPTQFSASDTSGNIVIPPPDRSLLYDHLVMGPKARPAEDFETSLDIYDSECGDDFIIPNGVGWDIESIDVIGSGEPTITHFNVNFYHDIAGGPAATAFQSYAGLTATNNAGVWSVTIPDGIVLGPGHYWFSVSDSDPSTTYGQWLWYYSNSVYNNIGYWRNPGGGFGLNAPVWTPVSTVWPGDNYDFAFRMNGSVIAEPSCDYTVSLYDSFGDGWNGCTIDVLVNGTIVLNEITLGSGAGPLDFTFPVSTGASITTIFKPGSFVCEPYYYFYDAQGNQVLYVPANCNYPLVLEGELYGNCPQLPGWIQGYVFNYDGLSIAGATVGIEGGPTAISGANGYYILENAAAGDQLVYCGKSGFNLSSTQVNVPSNDTVSQDFTLTQPNMIINPLTIEQTLNPNEYFTMSLSVLNNGNGPLAWTAQVVYPQTLPENALTYPQLIQQNSLPDNYQASGNPTGLAPKRTGNPAYPNVPVLDWGRDVDSQAWAYNAYSSGGLEEGTYTFILNNPGTFTYLGPAATDFIAGADFAGDTYYGCVNGGTWVSMDTATGVLTYYGSSPDFSGVAYDITTQTMYAVTIAGQLYTVDLTSGTSTLVGNTQAGLIAIACDNDGEIYGVDIDADMFGHVDKASGAWSTIASVGFNASYAQDMACDHLTNTIYWAAYNAGSGTAQLLTVDQTSGTSTFIGNFAGNAEITGFAIPGGDNWLTMDYYEGVVNPFGGVDNVPTHLDASGKNAAEVYTADILFSSDPNVGTIDVPVTMIVMGPALEPPDNLSVTLTNDITGEVHLTWDWVGDSFQFFMIKRDGVIIGTTTNQYYTDILPDFGNYCYTVQAVYDEGQTAPAGPECILWPNPTLYVNPSDLEGWVWVGFTVDVYTTISNIGIGTLEYTFPEFVAMDLLNNPHVKKNQPGTPYDTRSLDLQKGDETLANTGYPIVLGAGGPDSFGYLWIDSDETGGPTFNWIDISGTGSEVTGLADDNVVGPYPIGFDFPFYGEDKSQFWVNSNGCIGFTGTNITLINSAIPTGSSTYKDFIAWIWDDMDPGNALSHVYYQSFDAYTVIQFSHYFHYPDGSAWLDAEMILYKTGRIVIMYNNLQSGLIINSCTVGIQSPDPSLGLQVAYNTSYIHDGLAILFDLPADFIVSVQPPTGLIAQGGSQNVKITYDTEGYDPGDYTQDLMFESNDPSTPEYTIGNTMHVYVPAQFAGMVVDNDYDSPLPGVTVSAGVFQTETAEDGTYSLLVDEGTYDVTFDKLGYQTVIVPDTMAPMGVVTPVSVGMWDMNYPPAFVQAEVMDNDTWCQVTWALPAGPYEIIMDDGSAEDYVLWQAPGSQNAVKFTPSGYPATVIGGRFYVGDGSFPEPFLGTEFGIVIYAADGTNGLPGTMLDSSGVTVNNYGWVSVDWMNAEITEGDFYVAMLQTAPAPHSAPLGVDMTNPTYYKSYSKIQGNPWSLSAYQDFMIRAWVNGPEGVALNTNNTTARFVYPPKISQEEFNKIALSKSGVIPSNHGGTESNAVRYAGVESASNRNVANYQVARYSDFDPNGSPDAGTLTELATTGNLSYNDMAWADLPMGWYAYGVKAKYTSGDWSDYAISKIVGHMMDYNVMVNVTLNSGLEPSNVAITMQGMEYPYETYTAVTPASGQVIFDPVWRGNYSFEAFKIGYDLYRIDNIFVNADKVINVVLAEKKYPPTNLFVNPLTLKATWNEPLITALTQDFEGADFPPAGWQKSSLGQGWFRTNNGGSSFFPIPAWNSYYACDNDDVGGAGNVGSMDYLITPMLDLRESDGYALYFDSYYDGAYGQLAYVEYSTDGGATWQVLSQMIPSTSWTAIELDLSSLSGSAGSPLWLAFHADDAGTWASGWAVDNVKVQVPDPAANYLDFYVFLDDAYVASTTETNYNYAPLDYGVEYTASVAARFASGISEKDYYTFTSVYLIPPRNLQGTDLDNAAILHWQPPLTTGEVFTLLSEEPRKEFPNVNSEYSPTVRKVEGGNATRAPWDLEFAFATADNTGEGGAETDGEYFYTTMWRASGFQKYNLDGSYVGPLSVGSVSNIRDLAYDDNNGHMYGSAVSTTVNEMDFTSGTLVGTFTAPTDVRAIAYDPQADGFWANNWSTTITLFDMSGTVLNSFPVGSWGNYYGFAYDGWTDGGPYLWGFSQDGSTNMIVQIEIATGQETGFTKDVSGILITGTGIAGGLFTQANIVSGKVTIGGNSQNDVFFGYELADTGSQTGQTPPGLIGYNVYRGEQYENFLGYIVHPDTSYVDANLDPGVYNYGVTAVYDLAPYGYPDQTGESMVEGPAVVTIDYCYDLEFTETWALGNFDANNWTPSDANWGVDGQTGNPAPSAAFSWDPIQTDYSQGLESYPLCGLGMTEGTIWLDYDLKLNSMNPTGEEMLDVQVWNWESQVWTTVVSYSNLDGSFRWMNEHQSIKAMAMNKVFKIRFMARGDNSLDILGWFVDNIHVYRTCDAPTDLVVTIGSDPNPVTNIYLTWNSPMGGAVAEWLHWDDGVNFNAVGTGAAAEFDCAARWEPSQLTDYDGTSLTQIAFYPNEAAATYHVRVWKGAGAANMVVDQTVANPVIGAWNYITLTIPVPVDINQELWIGYYVNSSTGFPAGCDAGPAIDGYGNMINFGGWQTLLHISQDYNYNWNIQGFVKTMNGATAQLGSLTQVANNIPSGTTLNTAPGYVPRNPVFAGSSNGSRVLSSYNVYRNFNNGPDSLIANTTETSYVDDASNLTIGNYCYKVSSVFESETDYCESDYSNMGCVDVTGIGENNLVAGFNLYPNPAVNYVNITSGDQMKRITLYNSLGQLIRDEVVNTNKYELNTASYKSGVYMLRVQTDKGVSTHGLTIKK